MDVKQQGIINKQMEKAKPATINQTLNAILDQEGLRKRFDDLLGKRAPQFISAVISLVNADGNMQQCFGRNPMSVIQCALKAATFDLPIDPNLGYAYLVPFGSACTFILGYKGMIQLALRTGAYRTLNVTDVREGELVSYNRLTEEIELSFIEDEEVREKTPVIGYAGYYRLVNGTEKTIYMSLKQIDAHEKANRKGNSKGKGWRENYEAMCAKTVLRRLIGKWGLMSIDYRKADERAIAAAEALATSDLDDGLVVGVDYELVEDEAEA